MNNVLHHYPDKFIIVFNDHIFIYFKNEEEHGENLLAILSFPREN